uniref:Zgc:113279 n=1 Tax=Mastacembelus armatus TaxID=205130 RepID=A0A3Q3N0B6_9TELE
VQVLWLGPTYGCEKVYLGVRVKMPVRDLLRNIRLAQDLNLTSTFTGDKKRVKTRTGCRTTMRKHPTKSLEELAIIVEVLEEDLRTSNMYHLPSQSLSSDPPVSPEQPPSGNPWLPDPHSYSYSLKYKNRTPIGVLTATTGYNSDESDEMIPSPQSYLSYSPGTAEYHQDLCPPGFMHTSIQQSITTEMGRESGIREEWFEPQNHNGNLNSSAFFWAQLQKEESQLRDISDAVLLATDGHGRIALHNVACSGKRALGFAIAKRMAALNTLDLKDCDGMTALLHAAKHNHHLMVADLIYLGANVNERNNLGKSCLHLSAEKGYIQVLEVLKQTMMDGVYVDVEATDKSGMSVLQCASVALKATVCELESSKYPSHNRLHTLHQEQMLETLECLLQMGSYVHIMVYVPVSNKLDLPLGSETTLEHFVPE